MQGDYALLSFLDAYLLTRKWMAETLLYLWVIHRSEFRFPASDTWSNVPSVIMRLA